jgi:hypothetical protein
MLDVWAGVPKEVEPKMDWLPMVEPPVLESTVTVEPKLG